MMAKTKQSQRLKYDNSFRPSKKAMAKKTPRKRAKPDKGLNLKQIRFIEEYMKDLNASQAALRAGYSPKTAHAQGCALLKNPKVAHELKIRTNARSKSNEITADRVLKELARLGFSDMRNLSKWGPGGVLLKDSTKLDDDSAAAVAEVSQAETRQGKNVKIKLHDKPQALDKLARHLGLFRDTLHINGEIKFSEFSRDFTSRMSRLVARKAKGAITKQP
jgi:phage terminase small subunit